MSSHSTPRGGRGRGAGARAPALLLAALALAGCESVPAGAGAGGGDTAVVEAGGRSIRITPPEGFCVDPASIRPSQETAFVLIEDCALLRIAREGSAAGAPAPRPAVVNGLVTLSLGDRPLFDGPDADQETDFAALERFLRSDPGRGSAGMGGDPGLIRIVETRRAGDTLYVLVEDRGEQVVPLLGDRFWRAFTELNGRAAIASLGVFAPSELRDAEKLAHLARVVAALKRGNGSPVTPAEEALATPPRAPSEAAPSPAAAGGGTDAQAAPPPARPGDSPAPGQGEASLAPAGIPPARPAGLS
ncbi:MAG: hypothetical protein ACQEUZ_14655 [Pseudomonadota bacterium]